MTDERDARSELVPIGGLWTHEDRDGHTFLSGYLGQARLFVFKNTFKKAGEKYPDYRMYVTRKPKPDNKDPLTVADPDPLASEVGDVDATAAESVVPSNSPF